MIHSFVTKCCLDLFPSAAHTSRLQSNPARYFSMNGLVICTVFLWKTFDKTASSAVDEVLEAVLHQAMLGVHVERTLERK
jgi:hypothetical protein